MGYVAAVPATNLALKLQVGVGARALAVNVPQIADGAAAAKELAQTLLGDLIAKV